MTEIFKFENHPVRFVGTADDPWWVAKDVCEILDISKYRDALARLDEDERCPFEVDTLGGKQQMICINESGLYSLILTSRKPQAKKFKKWITSKVLPAIRKTGSYSVRNAPPHEQLELSIDDAIALANLASESAQNAGVDKSVSEQIKLEGLMKMYPDSEHLIKPQQEAIAANNPMPEKPMTPTEVGQELAVRLGCPKISAKKVNSKLLELGYQVSVTRIKKSTGKEVHDYYQPTEKGKPHSTLLLSLYVDGEGKATKAQLRWFGSIVSILANNWRTRVLGSPQHREMYVEDSHE